MFGLSTLDEQSAKNLSTQVLAFVGDAVYTLYIREKLTLSTNLKGRNLHNEVTSFVKATGQSDFIGKILPMLNETEVAIFKRARNHKTLSSAKNASIVDYRRATGLEAVIGYLYLTGNMKRLTTILNLSEGTNFEN